MKTLAVKLAINVSPSTRTETLDNVEYVVAPAVLMPEGVHNGSNGPIYYPAAELAKYAASWNLKPVVVNHPTLNGLPVSAANKKVIEDSQIGFLLNVAYQDKKQKGEVWINKAKAQKIESKILENLAAGIKTELSTGLFVDCDEVEGTWNGEAYIGTATGHRPDHLAILPDSVGAASIADGAGLLANSVKDPSVLDRIRSRFLGNGKPGLTLHELSFSQITCQLEEALRVRFGKPGRSWYGFVYAVYVDGVIFEDDSYKLWKLGYSYANNVVTLDSGEPTAVTAVTSYVTVNGTLAVDSGRLGPVPKISTNSEKVMPLNKDELFGKIIGDGKPFSDADKEALGKLPDEVLAKLGGVQVAAPPATNKETAPVVNTTKPADQPKVTSLKDLVDNLAPADKEMLSEMTANFTETKTALIEYIANAKGNILKKEDLAALSMNVLKGIAAPLKAAAPPAPGNYTLDRVLNFGAAAPAVNHGPPKHKPLSALFANEDDDTPAKKKDKESAAA